VGEGNFIYQGDDTVPKLKGQAAKSVTPIRYIITPGPKGVGVNLSRSMSWGNLRYPDVDAALGAVKANSRGAAHSVEKQGC
jgi:hypothetical protein